MHKKRLIRRFHDQKDIEYELGDIENLIDSGMYLEKDNPYYREECEWGLLIDKGGNEYKRIFPMARQHGITVIPGMRIGMGQYPLALTDDYWLELKKTLHICMSLTDSTKRIMFDVENYPTNDDPSDKEYYFEEMSCWERSRLVSASSEFMSIIRLHNIIPLFHPATPDMALAELIAEAAAGEAVAQVEHQDPKQLEYYLSNSSKYYNSQHAYNKIARYWMHKYPNILVSYWTSETVLRKTAQEWVDVVQSMNNLSWVFDYYRKLDTKHYFATLKHYNYEHISNHTNLRRVWQFSGVDQLTERISKQKELAATYGTIVSNKDHWPSTRVNRRQGNFTLYAVYDENKLFNPRVFVNVFPNLNSNVTPWSAVLTFAIDPLVCGYDGKNGWQRGGILFNQWENHEERDLLKLEVINENDIIKLKLTVKTSQQIIELTEVIPEDIMKKYVPIKILTSLGHDFISMSIKQGDITTPIQQEQLPANTTYPIITPSTYLGSFYNAEFISLYVWDDTRLSIPPDEWPFHSNL